jgi:hypothetical protein
MIWFFPFAWWYAPDFMLFGLFDRVYLELAPIKFA